MSLSDDLFNISESSEPYDGRYTFIKTSKDKDAILHRGFYYNYQRANKKSDVYKCRVVLDK